MYGSALSVLGKAGGCRQSQLQRELDAAPAMLAQLIPCHWHAPLAAPRHLTSAP